MPFQIVLNVVCVAAVVVYFIVFQLVLLFETLKKIAMSESENVTTDESDKGADDVRGSKRHSETENVR